MATKILTLDPLFPDGTPAAGTRLSVSVDRDVAIVGQGVVSRRGAVRDYRVGRDGLFPTITVVPNDDPSLQEWSKGYALIIEAEPTPLGGVAGGPWTVVVTSNDAATLNLSDLDAHNVVGLPPNISLADTMSRLTNVEATAADAKTSAQDSATSAASSLASVQGIQADVAQSAADAAQSAQDSAASAALVGAPAGDAIDAHLGGDATGLVPGLASITPRSANRAVGQGELMFNAKDFGATGDGSTDDTAALNEAIGAANVSTAGGQGAIVYLPPGTYKTGGITLPANVQLRGAGQRASRVSSSGATTTLTVGTNCVVSDLQITGDNTSGGIGISATAAANHWSIVDCWITGRDSGVSLTNTYIATLTRCTIQSCTTGILIPGTSVNAIYVMNGEIQGCTNGVSIGSSSGGVNVTFYGVTIEGCTGYGILQGGPLFGVHVRDCYFEANASGHIYQSATARMLSVTGCTFAGVAAYSIKLDAGLDTIIEGCLFYLASPGGASITAAAAVQRTTIHRCWYQTGQEFNPANYLGTGLLTLDRGAVLIPKSTTSQAAINLGPGVPPTAPADGDMWVTGSNFYVQIGGVTKRVTVT